MGIFEYVDDEALGRVRQVDTSTVVVHVENLEKLRQMQVNRLVALQSSKPGQHLVGMVNKITRTAIDPQLEEAEDVAVELDEANLESNLVRVTLIGTLIDKYGSQDDVFRRPLESVPEIDANCFAIEGNRLTSFMQVISEISGEGHSLALGNYTLDDDASSFLNGNKFFQRHAIIVGSTGSGKSWTTARILEQASVLPNVSAIVFDVHGEYKPLISEGMRHFRVAGPSDLESERSLADGVVYLPYWLLGYESLVSLFVDRSDQNAPNQAMVISRAVTNAKKKFLEHEGLTSVLQNFTVDSPVPYAMDDVIEEVSSLNTEMVKGSSGREKQGDFHGKLSRMIARLENKISDRRLGFLFKVPAHVMQYSWLSELAVALMAGTRMQPDERGGVKVIDFSEVPSDVLPIVVSLVGNLCFTIQQWSESEQRHPVALFCDEAHNYIPERSGDDSAKSIAVRTFERIAKEGRKYGLGLVVISQRPSEVNRTVLSQCNNLLAMRLTNAEDQTVVRRLLPDSLGGLSDVLPILDTGEALVVGDASLLPSRIRITEPTFKPTSGTVPFWDIWNETERTLAIDEAVEAWRRQSVR